MSGGSMEYVFSRINEAADRVLDFLQDIDTSHDGHMEVPSGKILEVALENYGEKSEFKSGDAAFAGIKKRLWDAYVTLRKASIYAQRVEWWQSGDDGWYDFIGRTDEELSELEKELKAESNHPYAKLEVLAQGFANNEDSCANVAGSETADVATVFGKIAIETDKKTENRA